MQRINPTGFVRVGGFTYYVTVFQPRKALDPTSGGMVALPTDPELVLRMFCAIEPFDLNVVREHLAGGGQMINVGQYLVTCWYQSGLRVSQYLEYTDVASQRLRHLEILVVRDQAEGHRYQELLCQERLS